MKNIKSIIPRKFLLLYRGYRRIRKYNPNLSLFGAIFKCNLIYPNSRKCYKDDYTRQFSKIVRKIKLNTNSYYIYPYDPKVLRLFNRTQLCSITVDYNKILKSDLKKLAMIIDNCEDQSFKIREKSIIKSIEEIAKKISSQLMKDDSKRAKVLSSWFPAILYREPLSLDEALQKILFYNALFWQMGHRHIGLGRLDYILYEYYDNDIKKNIINDEYAKTLLREFILIIGKDTISKSVNLVGDTGQYILLGGVNKRGQNVDNRLSEIFFELMTELKIPDPKLILRVNKNTGTIIWKKAIRCVITGIGSPLIMGETTIMENMIRFGYKSDDVWNVGTSACWEPLVIGKSFDQNNPFPSAVAIRPLNKLILSGKEYPTFEELLCAYKEEYKEELKSVVNDIDFDCSPLFTLFFDQCIKREKDFSEGGADYSYHGAQVVSLPNTINALLNIKKFVYDDQIINLSDCKTIIETNFEGFEDLRLLLTNMGKKFGEVDNEVIQLTNDIIHYTGEVVKQLKCNGNPVKVGFSSPSYIKDSSDFPASLDGRKKAEPFAVHISPLSSKIDISEILEFSSMLIYNDNCLNGNVVDFILPSSYVKESEKLVGIIKNACQRGVFELQLNVMDRTTLIDAKKNPEKYPNLVVRVWGFSAYFNDLPEEFKDNLIRRAGIYEAA